MASMAAARRILFLLNDLGGGTGNHLLSMVQQWNPSFWQAGIVSEAELTARVVPTVPIEFLPARRWFDRYPVGQVHRLGQFARRVAQRSPDIVHTYFIWPIVYGRILKRLGKVRALVENREDEGFDWHDEAYALLRATRGLPDRVICVSEAVRRVVLAREGLDPERVVVIRNGLDPGAGWPRDRARARQALRLAEDHVIVGMVANFNRPVKGVGHFLDAIPSIVCAVPRARFFIVGTGDEEGALRDKARALRIEPFVIFGGYRADIDACYAAMDISALTSLSEGLSITLLESMRHSLPVVATRVGGNPEVVLDGVSGYLVPAKTPEAFADRVLQLLRDPDLRTRMGRAGRRRVEHHFHIRDVAQQYLDVYDELLERQSAAA
jgi:glycosyltransferase involved in cell wall biosynthesis